MIKACMCATCANAHGGQKRAPGLGRREREHSLPETSPQPCFIVHFSATPQDLGRKPTHAAVLTLATFLLVTTDGVLSVCS